MNKYPDDAQLCICRQIAANGEDWSEFVELVEIDPVYPEDGSGHHYCLVSNVNNRNWGGYRCIECGLEPLTLMAEKMLNIARHG